MPTIRVDDDVYEGLEKLVTKPFTENPNSIIRKLLIEKGIILDSRFETKTLDTIIRLKDSETLFSFTFDVNETFLHHGNHHITIPSKYHNDLLKYDFHSGQLGKEGKKSLLVVNSDGFEYPCYMYYGISNKVNGGNHYYQLMISKSDADNYCGDLNLGDKVEIKFMRSDKNNYVKFIKYKSRYV